MEDQICLFQLMFGEQAEMARDHASPGMLRWAGWFGGWLAEHAPSPRRRQRAMQAWGEFCAIVRRPPWEAQQRDVYAYIEWMKQKGRGARWISACLSELSSFYEYADRRAAEAGEQAANPVRGVSRPRPPKDQAANCLDMEQTQALLEAIRADETTLGKRDYAMALLQLISPLRPREVRELKWGDLHFGDDGKTAVVEIQKSAERVKGGMAELDAEVAAAILDYLGASGRRETIQAEDFVFPPLRHGLNFGRVEQAECWDASRPMSLRLLLNRVQCQAERAGLQGDTINWVTLRNTAVLLRMQAGDRDEDIQRYFGFQNPARTRSLVKSLMATKRRPQWKVGGAIAVQKFGVYADKLGRADPALLEQAGLPGVKGEIVALRMLMLRALERSLATDDPEQTLHLLDSFSRATQRLAHILKAQRELNGGNLEDILTEITQAILREKGWEDEAAGG